MQSPSSSSRLAANLIKQAKQTFSNILRSSNLNNNLNNNCTSHATDGMKRSLDFEPLTRLLSKITKHDLNFTLLDDVRCLSESNSNSEHFSSSVAYENALTFLSSKAPVFYMKLYEDNLISAGIFIIKQNHKMPIHDHPNMYGLIKVLDGHGHINAYSALGQPQTSDNENLNCTKTTSTSIHAQSDVAVLYPDRSNIHEIYATNNDHCAFLDILAPPYSNENDCSFFEVFPNPVDSTNNATCRYLLKRVYATDYYTESLQYTGPTIS
ncbi:unnamed protein product [Didymodactylos carnosus]|uniref:Cysteine dioxygenase n=2 Tax=Didymodactylos carnosus TaxID=1234261 RepID=A0A816BLC2_9BILA|nr:unnamed protein product [Didymodactylos carnosus]CAF4494791.1 unnamed protein product [Didymodactylos carnosus]